MKIIQQPSPNFDSRNEQNVDMLILHYTGMKSAEAALSRLCDKSAKVSAHYLIDESGTIFQLVDERNRAWHAGVSYWRGNTNINTRSIGIEIVNQGHELNYTPFPKEQMESVANLCNEILTRHNIPAPNIIGHSDIAPTRKKDPGELFDWKFLAEKNIGIFPLSTTSDKQSAAALQNYGYDTTNLNKAIITFQRHFRPNNICGIWDDECGVILSLLNEHI